MTPLKIDISTGDAITPREIRYSFKLMLEDRSIDIWAYNLETVLAEKLETIITRTTTNTRMRDFYDIYIWNSCMGIHWTLRFSMMRCGPLLTNAGQNDILQKLPKFLRKWRTARLCRNFGNRTAKNFPMRQIGAGTHHGGGAPVYMLSEKGEI